MRLPFLCLLSFIPIVAFSQPPHAQSMDEVVAIAIKSNPRMSAAALELVAAYLGVRSANALADPNIVFAPGITSLSGTGEELLVSQSLELNGTRAARAGIAREQMKQTNASTTCAKKSSTSWRGLERVR